jgi:putative mRNA 3-end processing factor
VAKQPLIEVRAGGLYCPGGDFWVDPTRKVERAIITHGHSDHARKGHTSVLATRETLGLMAARMGNRYAETPEALRYGEERRIGDVTVRLAPAGHVLGSAQVVIEAGGVRAIVSGDYKRSADPTCPPFEPVSGDVFVTEATFGLPVFHFPPFAGEIAKLLHSLSLYPERTHVVGAYSLGKAQRVIAGLREAGFDAPVYATHTVQHLNDVYRAFGVDLGEVRDFAEAGKAELAGAIVVAPPMTMADEAEKRLSDPVIAFASGWMGIRAHARRRGVELPLVVSDHCDWDELTATIAELTPGETWITHGGEEALARWCALAGHKARGLSLTGYGEDVEEALPAEPTRTGTLL